MAFKSYLLRPYEHTHENSFFRVFSAQLRNKLKETDGMNVLIGNVSCNGHQIDALFVSRGRIIVIDFKNYGGKLTFSENNPWQMANGNDFVFVKGGGGIRNPYQQVNAYRHSLIQYLNPRQSEILEPNHDNFNLGHISSLVLFHLPVDFDSNEIPQAVQKYFGVADNNSCIESIIDRNSVQLNLSDNEITSLLLSLDIREENLYDDSRNQEPEEVHENVPNAVERLELVRKILSTVNFTNEIDKLLMYYQSLINIERHKEPSVQDEHPINIDLTNVTDRFNLNLENSPEFHLRFQQNANQQFPKNLFVGINFSLNTQTLPLLQIVIPQRDILTHTSIECVIHDFYLNAKPLEDRNYPDELVEELSSALAQNTTLEEKMESLRSFLGGPIQLLQSATLAFSEESPYTSQLLSELKKISKENLVNPNSFLDKFLTKKPINNALPQIHQNDFIQITPLNKNQKEAIRQAFNQPLSVITGPPGTGKTQVVVNILANAVLHNKKVLLASKNNQAVDNVKEKLTAILKEPDFFLRFGSKTEIRDKTNPAINAFVNKIHNNTLDDNSEQLSELERTVSVKKQNLRILQEQIDRLKSLKKLIPEHESTIESKKTEFQSWLNSQPLELIPAFEGYSSNSLNQVLNKCRIQRNEIIVSNTGLGKLFFKFSKRQKYAVKLVSTFESLSNDLKQLAHKKDIRVTLSEAKDAYYLISTLEKLIKFIEDGFSTINQNNSFKTSISQLDEQLVALISEERALINLETELRQGILDCEKELESFGLPLLNELIHHRLFNGDAAIIKAFSDYIPDHIPWRFDEIDEYVNTTNGFLQTFNLSAITSLSIKSAFPLQEGLFDMVVIDEASQCDIASALPLALRAKQLVVIGDPLQLKHISKVQGYEEKYILNCLNIDNNLRLNYVKESLYDYCYNLSIISKSKSVLLKEHFRCHPEIITYSNKSFYGPKLGQELDIKTQATDYLIEPMGLKWIDTVGPQHLTRNSNQTEVDKAVELACQLADKHTGISIGITTPFTHQAKDLNEAIPERYKKRIKADTVHKFQGDEKDIMIISLVITKNSAPRKAEWINFKVPYLINVAVTRARNTLYIVGDKKYCKTLPANSPVGFLVRYAEDVSRQ